MGEDRCYRVYVDSECVGTVFSFPQAIAMENVWFEAGYTANRVCVIEEAY